MPKLPPEEIIDRLTTAVALLEETTDALTAIDQPALSDEVNQVEETLRDLMLKVWQQLDPEDYHRQTTASE